MEDELTHESDPTPWSTRRLAAGAGLVALAVLVTRPAWADIARIAWRVEESSQVWLVPAVVAWLLVSRRQALMRCRPSWSLLGPAAIATGWVVSTVGYHNAIQSFWHGGAVLVAIGAVLTVCGWDVLRRLWPVFLVLVFLVPVPGVVRQQIALPLQTATASVTQFIFELVNLDVTRSGNVLHYNDGPVAVAEACNGMRMVFVLVLVCYAVAFASPLRNSVRVFMLAASPAIAIVCNVIRLVPTVYVYGHYSETTAHQFHNWAGWVMIVVAFLLVMGLIRLLQWADLPVMQAPAVQRSPSHAAYG